MSTSTTEQAKPGMSQGYVVHPDVLHAAKDVLSSVVGSAMCVYSGQPFDTLKVRMFATLWGGGRQTEPTCTSLNLRVTSGSRKFSRFTCFCRLSYAGAHASPP